VLCLALLIAPAAMAQSSSFLLGVDYSEWYGVIALRIATDNSGAVYVLGSCPGNSGSCVTKLSADGNTILWQNQLAFSTYTMAVDPSGGVYVVPVGQLTDTTSYVAKLGASGSGLAWEVPLGALLSPRHPRSIWRSIHRAAPMRLACMGRPTRRAVWSD
jgi:hypothetical protein